MVKDFQFRGMFCPIPAPFQENLAVDYDDLRAEVEFCVRSGMQGIVTNVNAGEFYTLSDEEHEEITKEVAKQNDGRLPLIAGVAGWSAKHSAERARQAEYYGYDAVMSMPPVLVRPVAYDDIRRFYARLDKAVSIPVCIQNASPGPVLTPEQVFQIARECENVQFVKEESDSELDYVSRMAAGQRLERPGVFGGVMSGKSGLTFIECYKRGACGCMPSAHLGDIFAMLWDLLESGETEKACALHGEMTPFLLYEPFYKVPHYKFALWKRGVIKRLDCRGNTIRYDRKIIGECERLLAPLEKYFKIQSRRDLGMD
ncbi:MAG: dihydrodipicolinate synthase family protein [Gracilibacteraceae bacterium]|jgi:4-hydroxy-tetrahydrodipicolinate synthase|nr:dihydrodipicolinate synthase family protein [Gracilibacteraceae bacterium]